MALRLFFALNPSKAEAAATARAARAVLVPGVGRAVDPSRLHLTLRFLGSVPEAQLDALIDAARPIKADAFPLVLDRVGYWRRAEACWLGPSDTPPGLDRLVSALGAALARAGFGEPPRRFRPHVTIGRKIDRRPAGRLSSPVVWSPREFVLVRSVTGGSHSKYTVEARFPLAATGA